MHPIPQILDKLLMFLAGVSCYGVGRCLFETQRTHNCVHCVTHLASLNIHLGPRNIRRYNGTMSKCHNLRHLMSLDCLASVVNTGEYYRLVGPGQSHVMLDRDTDQSRSTGHH